MALNIKDPETERLVAEVAELTGQTKTGVIREAMRERRDHLLAQRGEARKERDLLRFLRDEIWPQIPDEFRNRPITKAEREEILGYGPEGV